jgi:hypothetical protein
LFLPLRRTAEALAAAGALESLLESLVVRKVDMRQCSGCGLTTDSRDLTCPVCGRRLPLQLGISELAVRKIGLAVLIPVLVWIVMTSLLV